MRSFTFSSNLRFGGALAACGLLAVAVALIQLLGSVYGLAPSVRDNDALWWQERDTVFGSGSVAIIGSSRGLAGIQAPLLQEQLNRPVHQLSVLGANAVPFLEDLGADKRFSGWVIVEVTPLLFFVDPPPSRSLPSRPSGPGAFLEERLRLAVERSLLVRRTGMDFRSWLSGVARRHAPSALFSSFDSARTFRMDFDRYPGVALKAHRASEDKRAEQCEAISAVSRDDIFGRVASASEKIRRRGGRVTFVRLPSSGAVKAGENRCAPDATYFQGLAEHAGSQGINLSMLKLRTPDGTHLLAEDADRLTVKLGAMLTQPAPR